MAKSFHAQVRDQTALVRRRMRAIQRKAAERVIRDAQRPTAKGGNMRVDTGFLRASGRAELNGLPKGPVRNPANEREAFDWDPADVVLTINSADFGDVIFFGWSAEYARLRESKDKFLGLAAQKWEDIVADVAADARARIR